MLFYRMLKRGLFMKREFRKYFGYAIGEILLVIAGIIIALQIDTWYENKQAQERLGEYLANIEHDISDDARRLEQLETARNLAFFQANSIIVYTSDPDYPDPDWYDADFAGFAGAAVESAQRKHYFIANSGSYRALSSSGLLSEMTDPELESMLYDYYRTVGRIGSIEDDINSAIRQLSLRFNTEVGQGLSAFARREPLFLWNDSTDMSEAELLEARKAYWRLLTDPITQSLLRNQVNQTLLREYEHLLTLGERISARITSDDSNAPGAADVYSADGNVGHPILIENGMPGFHSFGIFDAPANSYDNFHNVYPFLKLEDDALRVQYPGGDDWAYLYFLHGPLVAIVERFPQDYSMYDRIRLELKRSPNTDCADLLLEIKDVDDAQKGGLQNIPLELTADWLTYTFDLSHFVEADLTELNVVAGFLFLSDAPCSLSIRDIRYLKPGQD